MKVSLELRPSKIHKGGIGAFALVNFKKGQKVAGGISRKDYEDIIPWEIFKRYPSHIRKKVIDFCIGTQKGFIPPEGGDFNNLSVEWCFNHSCDGNLGFDKNGDFIARKNIRKGDEISFDYGLADSNPAYRLKCECRSKNCRKVITGNDWKDPGYRKKQSKYLLHVLKEYDHSKVENTGRAQGAAIKVKPRKTGGK